MKVKRTGWHQLLLHKPRPTGSVTARSCKNWRPQAFVRSLSIGLSSSTAVETFQNRNAITGQAGLSSLLYSRIVFFEKHEDIKAVAEAAVRLRALRQETMRKLNYSLPARAIFRLVFSV